MTQEGKLILFWLVNGFLHFVLVYFSPNDESRNPLTYAVLLIASYYLIFPFFFRESHLLGFGLNVAPDNKLGRLLFFVMGAILWVPFVYHAYKVP